MASRRHSVPPSTLKSTPIAVAMPTAASSGRLGVSSRMNRSQLPVHASSAGSGHLSKVTAVESQPQIARTALGFGSLIFFSLVAHRGDGFERAAEQKSADFEMTALHREGKTNIGT